MDTAVSLCYSWLLKPDEREPRINCLAYRRNSIVGKWIAATAASANAIKLELYHPQSTTGDIWLVDAVAYMLCALTSQNDVELVLTLPTYPLTRNGPTEHQLLGLRTQFGSVELEGKMVTFIGATANVPAPWYSVGSFSQFEVAALNLHCTLSQTDFAHLLKNATSDRYPIARFPLKLYVRTLQSAASERNFYVTRLRAGMQTHSSRIQELSVAKVSETFQLLGLLHQQQTYTSIRALSIDIRRQECDEVLLSLWKFQALVKLTVTCKRCQIPWLKKMYAERNWVYDERCSVPKKRWI